MKIRFLTVARVLFDKGYSELIEASKRLQKKYHNIEFQWLGGVDEGYPEFVPYKQIIHDQDRGYIKYYGYKKNVKDYIHKADCIVLPSYHEGMSRTLMEALAMGKPIIASNIAGCKETVDEGKNGFLCKPKDPISLMESIEKFIKLDKEERKEMGLYSRKKAESQFDINNVITTYDNILEEYFSVKKINNKGNTLFRIS